jgi:uncharacterized RDD family membrane protein YckC
MWRRDDRLPMTTLGMTILVVRPRGGCRRMPASVSMVRVWLPRVTKDRAMATAARETTTDPGTLAVRPRARTPSPGTPLDTTVRLVTPERIVFQYPLAGPFHRFGAYLIDLAIWLLLVVVASIVSLVLALGSASGIGLFLVAYFVLTWGYGATCEGLFNGQTLGKRIVGIRVVSDRGVPITGAQAVLRNLVGAVDGLIPFFYLLGLASMVLTRRFQRLGDLAAGTMVVIEERRRRLRLERVDEREIAAVLAWLPLRISAGPELARALSDYVRSRGKLNTRRREEVAARLAAALQRRYGLPDSAAKSGDALLCAAYHRVFLGE